MKEELRWLSGSPDIHAAVEGWLRDEQAGEILRDNPRRRLIRIDRKDGAPLLLKHFRTGTHHALRERVKGWLGRSPAEREARHLGNLQRAGVPVPEPLALGDTRGGDRFLVLPFLKGGAGVEALSDQFEKRAHQLQSLGEAVASLHRAGFAHGDLHAGNILFQEHGAILLDLQHARRSDQQADRIRDLGELDYSFWGRGSVADRMRIRRAALSLPSSRTSDASERHLLSQVGEAARDKAWRHGESRTRRLMKPGRLTASARNPRGRGLRWREFHDDAVGEALEAHEEALTSKTPAVMKDDPRSRMTRVSVGGRSVIVKEILSRSVTRSLADVVRGSGAKRGWRAGHGLRVRGLRAALPLAFIEQRRLGWPLRSWLVVEDLAPAVDLLEQPAERRETLLRRLGPWLARLHARGVDHGDLKATHLFIETGGSQAEPVLVDLEAVRFLRRLPDSARRQALAELNASLPDDWSGQERCRALRRYATTEPFDEPFERALEQIVEASLERKHRWKGNDCAVATSSENRVG